VRPRPRQSSETQAYESGEAKTSLAVAMDGHRLKKKDKEKRIKN